MTQTDQTSATLTADGGGMSSVDQACLLRPDTAALIQAYFTHVPEEDRPRDPQDVLSVVDSHLKVAQQRSSGHAAIRIFNPGVGAEGAGGWSATSTVIDIVNDDMPYVVESVVSAITATGVTVHRVLHPILAVRRDASGALLEVAGESRRGLDPQDCLRESWVHILIDRLSDAELAESIETTLHLALESVRAVVTDSAALIGAAAVVAAELRSSFSPRSTQEVAEATDFLYWLTAGNLTFLGYRCDEGAPAGDNHLLHPVPGTGLGILRDGLASAAGFDEEWMNADPSSGHLVLTQTSSGTALSREVPPFSVAVRILGADGRIIRQHRFLGVLTPRALNAEITTTPVLRQTVATVLSSLGAVPDSYTGQRAMELLATYPRAELFWASPELVLDTVSGVLQLSSRRRLRAYLQPDPFGRFTSVLVYLPRDRYTTDARLAMQKVLMDTLHGNGIRYTARVGDSLLAAVHFTVTTDRADPVTLDPAGVQDLTRSLRATIRTWEDRLVAAVVGGDEELDTAAALARYAEAFDEAYKEDYQVDDAVRDLRQLDALTGPADLGLQFTRSANHHAEHRRLKLYLTGGTVTLSRVLPVLQSLGAEVIDERPYEVRRTDGTPSRIYDFGLRFPDGLLPEDDAPLAVRDRFSKAFVAVWTHQSEVDGFNGLVLVAGLEWRLVAVLRAYAHYLRQIGIPYTQGYLEQVLTANPTITADLAALFTARFDPAVHPDDHDARSAEGDRLIASITAALDGVSSLDADRILRTYLSLITATQRTNVYRTDTAGDLRQTMAFKLNPQRIPGVPKPVPAHEIWVYSPRLEGLHLRFGAVARGGLRWSDRPEDFRTEILGLVKAQEVKNAVIVPVGAKGGFVLKQQPVPTGDPSADRDSLLAEGVACYRLFIAALLDLTDNRIGGTVVPPDLVFRHDADDPYLVVAADKGTATFSDIANGVAADYGFWLGDAFASGGSVGYDHKAMGITARGAWESVRHHFREIGIDTQTQDFTCVGIGDMSGDVFGNGMLLSEHIRLVAAFDHRHVFIDPTPVAAEGFPERRRLFDKPRSSWADYDTELISAGGGVWPRSAKSVPISEQMRAALWIEAGVTALSPVELIRAALLAPVDLLWNGGIGTYVKASTEVNSAAGDKANDAVRVNGSELRARVVGEGGNLGVTQLGRIEFARAGGRINTDAIDNSAGVDTSDHEVNIKIALQPAIADGRLTADGRDELLASMTDEVGHLVLADNIAQNRVLGVARHHAPSMLTVHSRLIDSLVASGRLDRELEFLPNQHQINARMAAGEPLTSPELSVLLAYVKSALSAAMLADELPDEPAFARRLGNYFPHGLRAAAQDCVIDIAAHPLAREIVTTMTVNEVVNGAGITYAFRLQEEMAASYTDAIRAYSVVTAVFGLPELWADIAAHDNLIPSACQDTMLLQARRLLDRASRWILTHREAPLDVASEIERYSAAVTQLTPRMPRLVRGVEHQNVRSDAAELITLGAPAELANRVAYSLYTFSVLDIVDVAMQVGADLAETAELYYTLSAHLDFDRILSAVTGLERGDRWHALARQALRDDLYRSMRLITADVLTGTDDRLGVSARIESWESQSMAKLARARTTLAQIAAAGAGDLAALSVAASEVRSMVR
ncbi:NAD-glutamate dehydrogenase [Nakamurella sp. PAMC28650]|uniref:NAD-glutamate dehydrogenase n=1 Tax=Nakamurella sp. PAMC28650 TaxID=2762325 RepID=UPI00164D388D|nr:NAD-glutamate dehydrogenase [Nakamurella sp. PAMC28650]QNK80497.1 NAD-glutamate dehydrogenase [Nakamurella sp. PAMC28650]